MQAQPVKQSLDEHEMSMRWRTRTGFHIKAHQKAYNARLSHHRTSKQKIGKITACVQWQVQGRRALGCVLSCLLTTAILLCNRTLRTCQAAQHMHLGIRQAPARSAHGHHSQAEAPVRHIPANANVWHALALPGPRHSLQPIKRQGEGTLQSALHAHLPCHGQQHLQHAATKAWVPRPEITLHPQPPSCRPEICAKGCALAARQPGDRPRQRRAPPEQGKMYTAALHPAAAPAWITAPVAFGCRACCERLLASPPRLASHLTRSPCSTQRRRPEQRRLTSHAGCPAARPGAAGCPASSLPAPAPRCLRAR